MANEQNLIPFDERTESEQREIAQMGGVASGAARRRKKSLKEAADLYLSLPVRDKRRLNAMLRDGIDPEEADNQMAVVVSMAKMAMAGDSKCAKVLMTMLGEAEEKAETQDDGFIEALREEAESVWQEG